MRKKRPLSRRRRLSAELQNVREAPGKLGEAPGKLGEAPTLSNFLEKCCILEKSRKNLGKFGENSAKFWQNLRHFGKKQQNFSKNSAIFNENFEIRDRCKGVHQVDLGESFPTHILLQPIQPITSRLKFLTQGGRRFLT